MLGLVQDLAIIFIPKKCFHWLNQCGTIQKGLYLFVRKKNGGWQASGLALVGAPLPLVSYWWSVSTPDRGFAIFHSTDYNSASVKFSSHSILLCDSRWRISVFLIGPASFPSNRYRPLSRGCLCCLYFPSLISGCFTWCRVATLQPGEKDG